MRIRCFGHVTPLLAMVFVLLGPPANCRSSLLEQRPTPSPNHSLLANVEWEDVGFLGLIRMKIYNANGDPLRSVELPTLNPAPANLMWIDDAWVGCESFIGENGSGFFYVHVPSGKAYLIEIVAPRPKDDWIFSVTSNDPISTAAIETISRGRTSLFPILLRNLPEREASYFTAAFCTDLAAATDAFLEFRRNKGFRDLELISDADIRPDVGALALANIDDKPHVVYFPAGTSTPQEMLSRARFQPVTTDVSHLLEEPDAPDLVVRWTQGEAYVVEGVRTLDNEKQSTMSLAAGRIEGAKDSPAVFETASAVRTASPGKLSDIAEDTGEAMEGGATAKKIPAAVTSPQKVKFSFSPSKSKSRTPQSKSRGSAKSSSRTSRKRPSVSH